MDTVENIEQTVTSLVDKLLEEREEAGIEKDVVEALKAAKVAVKDLTEKVASLEKQAADDAASVETLETKNSELEAEAASQKEELESVNTKLQEATEAASASSLELDSLKKDIRLKDRLSDLEDLKVLRKGDALETQTASVRDMEDEEFASYKEDLVSFRNELVASMTEFKDEPEMDVGVAEEPSDEKPGEAEASEEKNEEPVEEENVIVTPPADIEGAKETANLTLVNAESANKENKWDAFSKGMNELLGSGRSNS